ncbi:MAG: STAS domain-containing protein [Chlorobiales bacterium]|nr:STAS domain-containing protein [Chlorobiales bacterium]
MKYSVTIRKDLSILKIEEGSFDLLHAEAFNSAVDDLIVKEQSKNLIIDFSHVKAIDSIVITSIRFAQECANKNGGVVVFVSLNKLIKELLKLQELDKQLYIYSSINEVMTLIAPDIKGKKAGRVKKIVHGDDIIDELADLEVIAIPEIPENDLAVELESELEVDLDDDKDENDERVDQDLDDDQPEFNESDPPVVKKTGSKKRGRPKSENKVNPAKE